MALGEDTWVFGYGSLVWRPAFEFQERVPAQITGWTRRFWQASPDHRGTPEAPGRVVTLIASPGSRCTGMAYRVQASVWGPIMAALDHREKAGYEHVRCTLHLEDRRAIPNGLAYIAGPDNPNFLGPAPLTEMVRQIRRCTGPSGTNRAYLVELHRALQTLGAEDPHVEQLVGLL